MSALGGRPMSIAVGDALPEFSHTFTAVDLMAYGAATWDWHRNHYDQRRARELDFKDAFVDGQNFGSIFAREAMHWAGPRGFIRKMSLKFRSMVFVGETVTGGGSVSGLHVEGDRQIVTMEQHLRTDDELAATSVIEMRLPVRPIGEVER
jgi:acyl dehydratase